jgi:hypothetical protein
VFERGAGFQKGYNPEKRKKVMNGGRKLTHKNGLSLGRCNFGTTQRDQAGL